MTITEFQILDEKKNHITFTDGIGLIYKIHRSKLCPAIRTLSHQKTLHLLSIPDWLIIDRFDGDNNFWKVKQVTKILNKRKNHMKSRLGNIVLAGYGNYDFSASGSNILATCSDVPVTPTWTCWRLSLEDQNDAKILTLFLNSTFALAKMLDDSIEVRGSVRKWRKKTLLFLPVLDPKKITQREKELLLKLYDESSKKELPSLFSQLKDGNEIRNKIDKIIAKIVISSGAENNKKIRELQKKIAERILLWKQMMEG